MKQIDFKVQKCTTDRKEIFLKKEEKEVLCAYKFFSVNSAILDFEVISQHILNKVHDANSAMSQNQKIDVQLP